jgi:hypothetical protein
MTTTDANKAFIREMLGSKKELTDYPDRFDPKIMMHERQLLPCGGNYQGIDAFREFYHRAGLLALALHALLACKPTLTGGNRA